MTKLVAVAGSTELDAMKVDTPPVASVAVAVKVTTPTALPEELGVATLAGMADPAPAVEVTVAMTTAALLLLATRALLEEGEADSTGVEVEVASAVVSGTTASVEVEDGEGVESLNRIGGDRWKEG